MQFHQSQCINLGVAGQRSNVMQNLTKITRSGALYQSVRCHYCITHSMTSFGKVTKNTYDDLIDVFLLSWMHVCIAQSVIFHIPCLFLCYKRFCLCIYCTMCRMVYFCSDWTSCILIVACPQNSIGGSLGLLYTHKSWCAFERGQISTRLLIQPNINFILLYPFR